MWLFQQLGDLLFVLFYYAFVALCHFNGCILKHLETCKVNYKSTSSNTSGNNNVITSMELVINL